MTEKDRLDKLGRKLSVIGFSPVSRDQVVRPKSCSTEYVRRVSGDELYVLLDQQSCELHDFLRSAREDE